MIAHADMHGLTFETETPKIDLHHWFRFKIS